jgi:hypothetical protein
MLCNISVHFCFICWTKWAVYQSKHFVILCFVSFLVLCLAWFANTISTILVLVYISLPSFEILSTTTAFELFTSEWFFHFLQTKYKIIVLHNLRDFLCSTMFCVLYNKNVACINFLCYSKAYCVPCRICFNNIHNQPFFKGAWFLAKCIMQFWIVFLLHCHLLNTIFKPL